MNNNNKNNNNTFHIELSFSSSSSSSSSSGNNNHGKRKSGDGKAGVVIASADKENHVSSHVINATGVMTSRNQGNHVAPFSRPALDNVHPMIDTNKNIQVCHV